MESTSPGEPVKGRCSECVDQFDQKIKEFGRTYNGLGIQTKGNPDTTPQQDKAPAEEVPEFDFEPVKGEAPDLDLNLEPEPERGFRVPERDEYWK